MDIHEIKNEKAKLECEISTLYGQLDTKLIELQRDFYERNPVQNNALATHKELPNRDLLYISYDKNVPPVRRGIYFEISFNERGEVVVSNQSNQIPDPSTIYFHLPISDDYNVDLLPYWPHYIEMSSGQRCKYLTWLRNVEQPIDMGYVFIYYYGLERHLLLGDFDRAFDEIIKLRNAHSNKSFLTYSENALVHGAILRGRIDRLVDLHEKTEITGYNNAMFLIAHNEGIDLGNEQLLLVFQKAFPLSRKNIKEDRHLFSKCVNQALVSKFGTEGFPLKNYDISSIRMKTETRFANYSFSPELQKVEITDFYQCRALMSDLESVFRSAHDLYKQERKTRTYRPRPKK